MYDYFSIDIVFGSCIFRFACCLDEVIFLSACRFSPIADGVEADEYTALYRVKGLSLGRTILKFVATQKSELNVWSDSKEIQVHSFFTIMKIMMIIYNNGRNGSFYAYGVIQCSGHIF